jgi:hypothetical protein
VNADGKKQEFRPGASPNRLVGRGHGCLLHTPRHRALFKCFKSLEIPRHPLFSQQLSVEKCPCKARTTTRVLKKITTYTSFGPLFAVDTFRMGILPPSYMGYDFHIFSILSWSPTVRMSQPISLDSESTAYDSEGSEPPVRFFPASVQNKRIYLPQSPVMFAPVSDHRFPLGMEIAVDFGSAPPEELDSTQVRNYNPSVKYSPIVKMGLLFTVPPCLFQISPSPI